MNFITLGRCKPIKRGKMSWGMWTPLFDHWHEAQTCHQQVRTFCPMGEKFRDFLANQSGRNASRLGLMGWHRRTSGSALCCIFQYRVESTTILSHLCGKSAWLFFFKTSFSHWLLVTAKTSKESVKMTTTTTFQGISPGAKSSSR